MATPNFGFQMSEGFLRGYAEYLKQLREMHPGKIYMLTLSIDLVPDGEGYKVALPPQLGIDEVEISEKEG